MISSDQYHATVLELEIAQADIEHYKTQLDLVCEEGYTPADAAKLRELNHGLAADIDLLNREIAALRTHAKNHALEYISLAGQMKTYLEALPKFKADAVREAAKTVVVDQVSYMGDVEVVHIDELLDYADNLERGES